MDNSQRYRQRQRQRNNSSSSLSKFCRNTTKRIHYGPKAKPAAHPSRDRYHDRWVTPSHGSAAGGQLTLRLSDALGLADITGVALSLSGSQACYIATTFANQTAYLFLIGDDNNYGPAVMVGGSGSYSNSVCSIMGTGSSLQTVGGQLQLTINLAFSTASFSGSHSILVNATDSVGTVGFFPFGTWTVPSSSAIVGTSTTLAVSPSTVSYGVPVL